MMSQALTVCRDALQLVVEGRDLPTGLEYRDLGGGRRRQELGHQASSCSAAAAGTKSPAVSDVSDGVAGGPVVVEMGRVAAWLKRPTSNVVLFLAVFNYQVRWFGYLKQVGTKQVGEKDGTGLALRRI